MSTTPWLDRRRSTDQVRTAFAGRALAVGGPAFTASRCIHCKTCKGQEQRFRIGTAAI